MHEVTPLRPALLVRPEWLYAVVREIQIFAGSALADQRQVIRREGFQDALQRHLPPAETRVEFYVLKGFLADVRDHIARIENRPQIAPSTPAHLAAALLTDRFAERWTLGRISRSVGQNRSQLELEFKRTLSVSIHQFLIYQRIEAAKRLLSDQTVKIEAVAYSVGYRSKKAFYEAFERLTGMCPGAFRAMTKVDSEE
jgi:AraC-like DNA-binding protein